jgi:hypothetical protein
VEIVMTQSKRTEERFSEVRVTYTAKPLGSDRENGPHLGDLREFVAACDGLPDDLKVRIDEGHLNEGGRRDVQFLVVHRTRQPALNEPEHP